MKILTQTFKVIHSLGYLEEMKRRHQAQQALSLGLALSLKSFLKTILKNVKTLCPHKERICYFSHTFLHSVYQINPNLL